MKPLREAARLAGGVTFASGGGNCDESTHDTLLYIVQFKGGASGAPVVAKRSIEAPWVIA